MRLQRQLNDGGRTKLQVRPQGRPPYQAYNLTFFCGGYVDDSGTVQRRHQLFLEFPRAYPLEAPPTFKRVSPLFHPNIYPHGVFCLGFGAIVATVWAYTLTATALEIVGYLSLAVLDPIAAKNGEAPLFFASLRPIQMTIPIVALLALGVYVWQSPLFG